MKTAIQMLLLIALLPSVLSAKKQQTAEHAPLPEKVLAAKTIYIQNDSGYADAADKAYAAMKAWGRYEIVTAKEKADLILVLAITTTTKDGSSPSWVSVYNSQTGAWTNGTVETPSSRTLNFTQVTLLDPATSDVQWTDRRLWRRKRSATEELIKSLRQRVEEQEKQQSH